MNIKTAKDTVMGKNSKPIMGRRGNENTTATDR